MKDQLSEARLHVSYFKQLVTQYPKSKEYWRDLKQAQQREIELIDKIGRKAQKPGHRK